MSDLRVYLSSTLSDLREYRQAAIDVIRQLGLGVVLLEQFGAADSPPLEASLRLRRHRCSVGCSQAWGGASGGREEPR